MPQFDPTAIAAATFLAVFAGWQLLVSRSLAARVILVLIAALLTGSSLSWLGKHDTRLPPLVGPGQAELKRLAAANSVAPSSPRFTLASYAKQPSLPGDSITDCVDCPEMVIVQPGFFRMGALPGDAHALGHERPFGTVMIKKPYAIGRTEVTVGQYAAFVKETGHARPTCGFTDTVRDARLPIDCISWRDAHAYTRWLSAKTMKSFRLPTESEWTYAARGGASTRYALGDEIPNGDAHLEQRRAKRLPVGTYPANGYGLLDVHGSLAEMVADCWSDNLRRTPADASQPNRRGDCTHRVLKDAHSGEPETLSRLSARRPIPLDEARMGVGFRIMRQL